jgi:hypothetical protein
MENFVATFNATAKKPLSAKTIEKVKERYGRHGDDRMIEVLKMMIKKRPEPEPEPEADLLLSESQLEVIAKEIVEEMFPKQAEDDLDTMEGMKKTILRLCEEVKSLKEQVEKKKDKRDASAGEKRNPHRCQYIFTKGKHEGKCCGGASVIKEDGEPWMYCVEHLPYVGTADLIGAVKPIQLTRSKEFLEKRCEYVFITGKTKGTQCDRKKMEGCEVCSLHRKYKNKNNPLYKKPRMEESEEE